MTIACNTARSWKEWKCSRSRSPGMNCSTRCAPSLTRAVRWDNELVFETPQFGTLREEFTRRRALLIAPLALAGIVVLAMRRGRDSDASVAASDSNEELTIVEFNDHGQKLGP